MNKNNFLKVALLGAVILSGISFEARGMEPNILLIGAGVSTVALAITAVKRTATYKTYDEDRARRLEEKEKSENPFVHAQPLNLESNGISGNEKVATFQKQYDEQRRAEAQRCATKITEKTLASHVIDEYAGEYRK